RKSSPREFPAAPVPAPPAWANRRSAWPRSSGLRLRRCPPDHLHHRRHADIAMAHRGAAPAAHASYGKLALDEVVRKFAEEAPVAPVVHRPPRVESARHARNPPLRAGIPGAHPLHFLGPGAPVAHREAGARRAHVGAPAAFQAALPDLLPGFLRDLLLRNVADRAGKPAGHGALEIPPQLLQDGAPLLHMFVRPFSED